MDPPLRAPLEIGFDYTRSLGPMLSQFMTALARRPDPRPRGARTAGCTRRRSSTTRSPPRRPAELVEVGPDRDRADLVVGARPLAGQPLEHPFAWALIRLDGADTAMLHAVDAGSAAAMRTGMRVRARWADAAAGHIRDIACFEPGRARPRRRRRTATAAAGRNRSR